MPGVSVIVPAHDSAGALPGLLAALAGQTLEDVEVLVVDDGSRDGTADVARRLGARVITTRGRRGSYAARNLGVDAARAPVLAFTDADCRPRPEWLARAVAALERGADVVAGHVEVPLGPRPSAAALVDVARHLHQERNVGAGFGATANLVLRASTLRALGGFNPALRSGGDLELGRRARAAGLSLVYAPDAVVVHPPRATAAAVARKAFRLGRSRVDLARHADRAVGPRPAVWPHPGAWFPGALLRGRPVYGIERVEALAGPLRRRDRLRLALAEWAYVQVPTAAGDLTGTVRARLRREA